MIPFAEALEIVYWLAPSIVACAVYWIFAVILQQYHEQYGAEEAKEVSLGVVAKAATTSILMVVNALSLLLIRELQMLRFLSLVAAVLRIADIAATVAMLWLVASAIRSLASKLKELPPHSP